MYKSRDAKVKKQKETHSEIERKRRERMKRETEFLSTQLMDKAVRKDKLSVYKAGADQLLKYTEKLGKRDFILNDYEYSAIIVNNFNGISVHIGCADGEILWCHNFKSLLGWDENIIIGDTLYNICNPSFESLNKIKRNLFISEQEDDQLRNGEIISRNFVVEMKVSDKFSKAHCSRGVDGKWYRYVELCGDISLMMDDSATDDCGSSFLYKCLGRGLDLVSSETPDPLIFTVKLNPDDHIVLCIQSQLPEFLGVQAQELVNHNILDLIFDDEKQYFKNSLNECLSKLSLNLLINLKSCDQLKKQFSVSLTTVFENKKAIFIIARFEHSKSTESTEVKQWIKEEIVEKEEEHLKNEDNQKTDSQITFNLEESELIPVVTVNFTVEENQNQLSDCENLPSNESFKSLIGDCNDLFYPESIQDLVSEDINDIKCDDII